MQKHVVRPLCQPTRPNKRNGILTFHSRDQNTFKTTFCLFKIHNSPQYSRQHACSHHTRTSPNITFAHKRMSNQQRVWRVCALATINPCKVAVVLIVTVKNRQKRLVRMWGCISIPVKWHSPANMPTYVQCYFRSDCTHLFPPNTPK